MTVEDGHINQNFHSIYFEPLQQALAILRKEKLTDYDIVTDRNNIRKLSAALENSAEYPNFVVLGRKLEKTLVLKREEIETHHEPTPG